MSTLRSLMAAALLGGGVAEASSGPLTSALAQALGRERVLIVRQPPATYLQEMRRQDAELQVRDLRIVALLPPGDARFKGPATLMLTLLVDRGGQEGAPYGPATLIGKDGGVKARYKALPALGTVNALIDTMPMRQQERRERGR